uniref:Uncharacterized protein n=1 Tax=Tanacetum cinerariifolium TaxID=118510 RepID=A0A699I1U7_TANCI|nr:hypothetical protein [Tanacetum cinerariifolium]
MESLWMLSFLIRNLKHVSDLLSSGLLRLIILIVLSRTCAPFGLGVSTFMQMFLVFIENVNLLRLPTPLTLMREIHQVHAKEIEAWDPFICNDSYESVSSDDKEDAEDDGSQFGDKVTADNDVERVSESIYTHNNDLLYNNNHNNIMPDKEKVLSDDPFNLYDIQNKRKDSGDD